MISQQERPIIELRTLAKVYGSGRTVVKAVDEVYLHVEKGEFVLIMGPSGSGKTTLVQLIGALLKPTAGEVLINGKDIAVLSEKTRAKIRLTTFGFIFQTANLLSALTALQNVELMYNLTGIKGKQAKQLATELLNRVGLGDRLHHKPSELSGGEQQRVVIARALAHDPPILLTDEPTANLDSKTGNQIVELLKNITKEEGRTVLMVSHDLRIRYFADRVLWLEDGKLSVKWSNGVTIDPVCLMVVEQAKTNLISDYQGDAYYFCSLECQREFEKNPHQHAIKAKKE